MYFPMPEKCVILTMDNHRPCAAIKRKDALRGGGRTMEREKKQQNDVVAGRNPVLEMLRSGQEIESIYIQSGIPKGPLGRIVAMAKEKGIPVKEASAEKILALSGVEVHQGVAALVSAARYASLEDVYRKAGDAPLFLVLCDEIEDPHNLGAIIRTAEAAGAHGVVIPKRHSAGLTAAAVKAAAGAAAYLPVVRVPNLPGVMEQLKKERNMWFYCADMDGEPWCGTDYSGAVGLVVGSEGSGVSRLVREKCDFVVSLPMAGQVNSLNASVAAGIILYEVARQRLGLRAR